MTLNEFQLMTNDELERCPALNYSEIRFRLWQQEYWKRFDNTTIIEYEDEDNLAQ